VPQADINKLAPGFLFNNVVLALKARTSAPWAQAIPWQMFLDYVSRHANVNTSGPGDKMEMQNVHLICCQLVDVCESKLTQYIAGNGGESPFLFLSWAWCCTYRYSPTPSWMSHVMHGGPCSRTCSCPWWHMQRQVARQPKYGQGGRLRVLTLTAQHACLVVGLVMCCKGLGAHSCSRARGAQPRLITLFLVVWLLAPWC
jgi:hypothetical protein